MSSWADKTKGTSTVCKTIPQRELVLSWWRLATGCLFSENSKTRRYTMKSRSRWFVQRLEFKSYFVSSSQKSYHSLQRQKPWMRNCRTFIWHEILNSVFNNNRYASKWTAECILKFEMCLKHHGAKWHFGGRHLMLRKHGKSLLCHMRSTRLFQLLLHKASSNFRAPCHYLMRLRDVSSLLLSALLWDVTWL